MQLKNIKNNPQAQASMAPATLERIEAAGIYWDLATAATDPREAIQAYICLLDLSGDARAAGDDEAFLTVSVLCGDLAGKLSVRDLLRDSSHVR